jgi:hypothetical protein
MSQKQRIKDSASQSIRADKVFNKDTAFLTKIHINSDHMQQALFYEPSK